MKYLRVPLLLLATVLLVLVIPTLILAQPATQTNPSEPQLDSSFLDENGMPPVEDAVPYPYPIISTQPVDDSFDPASPDAIDIDVWYGDTQDFGQLGVPQEFVNIVGTVSEPESVNSLVYSFNGEPDKPINIGPDGMRLYRPGDFNIELPVKDLLPGANTVIITANPGSQQVSETVTVNYTGGNVWPIPYTANWGLMGGNPQAGAQVVDGRWQINGGKLVLAPDAVGYDRLIAIGDVKWTDYEVVVPVRVKSLNTAEWSAPTSNGAGVGILVRWLGHTKTNATEQPNSGWRRLGALAWHRWLPNGTSTFQMAGFGGGAPIATRNDKLMELEKDYVFKLSVQSAGFVGQPSRYRFKFWEAGQPEPVEWFMSALGKPGEPPNGSLLLVAHQAEVEFGNVEVRQIPTTTFTINKQATSNGQIILDPDKPAYNYGEQVKVRALGNSGFALQNWTGSFSGNRNPIIFEITQNVTVGGVFSAAPNPTLNITNIGQGTVDKSPNKTTYLSGDLVTLTPKPQPGYIFAGWDGDLTGADNPASLVMDTSKNITAEFDQANANSPVSDDFNSCALNSNLWTFVNPVGDGTFAITGTELQISVPANVSHNIWLEGNRAARLMQPTQNSNFEIITKFSSVLSKRYQMQGILVEQDDKNFIRFETYHDGGGARLYAATFNNGIPTSRILLLTLETTPSHLRVTRVGSLWGFSYSNDGTTWRTGGSFEFSLNVTASGVYAGNHNQPGQTIPAHTAIVDYFFNSVSPIDPEDPNPSNEFSIDVTTIGEGTVTRDPNKDNYQCNEAVTLTAVPASGWNFAGWSGDLSGLTLSQEVVMTKNIQVTATFTEGPPPPPNNSLYLPIAIK